MKVYGRMMSSMVREQSIFLVGLSKVESGRMESMLSGLIKRKFKLEFGIALDLMLGTYQVLLTISHISIDNG